jgi:NitT/TauT family transport system substrate-binding protein
MSTVRARLVFLWTTVLVCFAPMAAVDAVVVECLPADAVLEEMSFQLDWKFNAQFAGIFTAPFTAAGINMTIRPWVDGIDTINEVVNGNADFACAEQNLIIAAQAAGAPIKAVATMFQFSPYGLMAPPESNITTLADLRGKTVGVQSSSLKVMDLVKGVTGFADINVMEIPYDGKWNRTVSGQVAAVLGYVIDEPIGVRSTYGVDPIVLKLSDYGLQSTAQTIVVRTSTLEERPVLVTAALGAIFQGWIDALADKPLTARQVVDNFVPEGSVYKDYTYQQETLELLEPYVLVKGRDIGVIDPTVWTNAAKLMLEYGIVESLPENLNETLATDAYLGPFERDACDNSTKVESGVEDERNKRRRPHVFLLYFWCFVVMMMFEMY